MKRDAQQFIPVRRDLLVRDINDEVTLYDRNTNKAHCLNSTAAAVWRLCDGHKSIAEIARALQDADEELVLLALHELDESGLLRTEIPPIESNMLSRRQLVKRMSAGVALPIVNSVLVLPPSSAESAARLRKTRSRT